MLARMQRGYLAASNNPTTSNFDTAGNNAWSVTTCFRAEVVKAI